MAVDFYAKAGDRLPAIVSTLTDDTGTPIGLAGATATWVMRPLGEADPWVEGAAEIDAGQPGVVRYWWAAGDLDVAGTYLGEWQVVFADGRRQTFPSDRPMVVLVAPGVDDGPTVAPEDLDWLRAWVGSEPADAVLAERLGRAGREEVALGVLRQRRADLLADPISYSIRGDITVNAADNLKALDALIAGLEAEVAAVNGNGDGFLASARLQRVGGWGRGFGRR